MFKHLLVIFLALALAHLVFAQPDLPPVVVLHKYTQRTLYVSPDGRYVTEISRKFWLDEEKLQYDPAGTQVRLWETATGRLKWVKLSQANISAQGGFSPDGKRFICYGLYNAPRGEEIPGSHNRVNIWEIESGQGLDSLELEPGEVLAQLAFTPDGKALVGTTVVSPGVLITVKMWDAANGKLLRTVDDFPAPDETLLWPAKGNRLATSSSQVLGRQNQDNWLRVLSLPALRLLHSLNIEKELAVLLALSPDGKKLAYKPYTPPGEKAMSDRIHLWDTQTNDVTLVTFPDMPSFGVFSIDFSPDGQTLIGSGIDIEQPKEQQAAVWFWDARTGALQRYFNYENTFDTSEIFPHQIQLLPDGKSFVATGNNEAVVQRSLADGALIRTFEEKNES